MDETSLLPKHTTTILPVMEGTVTQPTHFTKACTEHQLFWETQVTPIVQAYESLPRSRSQVEQTVESFSKLRVKERFEEMVKIIKEENEKLSAAELSGHYGTCLNGYAVRLNVFLEDMRAVNRLLLSPPIMDETTFLLPEFTKAYREHELFWEMCVNPVVQAYESLPPRFRVEQAMESLNKLRAKERFEEMLRIIEEEKEKLRKGEPSVSGGWPEGYEVRLSIFLEGIKYGTRFLLPEFPQNFEEQPIFWKMRVVPVIEMYNQNRSRSQLEQAMELFNYLSLKERFGDMLKIIKEEKEKPREGELSVRYGAWLDDYDISLTTFLEEMRHANCFLLSPPAMDQTTSQLPGFGGNYYCWDTRTKRKVSPIKKYYDFAPLKSGSQLEQRLEIIQEEKESQRCNGVQGLLYGGWLNFYEASMAWSFE